MFTHCQDNCHEKGEGFSYGEALLVLTDECGAKYPIRLVTRPDPVKLTTTANQLAQQLLILVTRKPLEVTPTDVSALDIICSYSSVTVVNPIGTSGTFIGPSAIDALVSVLNTFKSTNYNGNQLSVTSRLITDDVLLLNIVINLLQTPTGPVIGTVTFSGQYQILECGAKLCIDFLTVNVTLNLA